MNEQDFIKAKNDLKQLIDRCLLDVSIFSSEKDDIKTLDRILNEYDFDNRYEMKGLLSRVIVDSLQISYLIGKEFIKFDEKI